VVVAGAGVSPPAAPAAIIANAIAAGGDAKAAAQAGEIMQSAAWRKLIEIHDTKQQYQCFLFYIFLEHHQRLLRKNLGAEWKTWHCSRWLS
jgi:hypothetical protein